MFPKCLLSPVLLIAAMVAGCGVGRAEKVDRVRGLSQVELAEIHASLDALLRKGAPMNLKSAQIPLVVARLQPQNVTLRGNMALIHLGGAVDDKAYVIVLGLGPSQGDKEIVLSPGEREPRQVLWRQSR